MCGEGGEFETLTLDSPLFVKSIVLESSEVRVHSEDDLAPVAYLRIKAVGLRDKDVSEWD